LPVGVVGAEGFYDADDLLAEGGFDEGDLAGPDLEAAADEFLIAGDQSSMIHPSIINRYFLLDMGVEMGWGWGKVKDE
jgi:hypothetical protein